MKRGEKANAILREAERLLLERVEQSLGRLAWYEEREPLVQRVRDADFDNEETEAIRALEAWERANPP